MEQDVVHVYAWIEKSRKESYKHFELSANIMFPYQQDERVKSLHIWLFAARKQVYFCDCPVIVIVCCLTYLILGFCYWAAESLDIFSDETICIFKLVEPSDTFLVEPAQLDWQSTPQKERKERKDDQC